MSLNNNLLAGTLECKKRMKFLKQKYKVYKGLKDTYTNTMRFLAKIDCYEYVSLVKPNNSGKFY